MEHMEKKGILIVISGFSGAGKGTLVRELLRRHGQDYVLSVSMTTRAPRPGERDGEEKLAEGKNVILEIEIQGALKIKEKFPESLLIFVTPPNAEELKRRLEGRGTESREVIASRLARAAEESEGVELYDYLVVNDKLEESAEEIHHLVAAARRALVRREAFVKGIREELHSFAKGAQE